VEMRKPNDDTNVDLLSSTHKHRASLFNSLFFGRDHEPLKHSPFCLSLTLVLECVLYRMCSL
jgi:hypothetical protein